MRKAISKRRPYHALREIVERAGGEMSFERLGQPPGGAWVVVLDGTRRVFRADGKEFLALARLYVPRKTNPTHASQFTRELVNGAEAKWLSIIRK